MGCREQLGELQHHLAQFRDAGIAVLAVSGDALPLAVPMAARLGLYFPLLSDPQSRVIYQYRMLNPLTNQAHMGYVLIDASGRLRARVIDPSFGTHSEAILQRVARWGATGASP